MTYWIPEIYKAEEEQTVYAAGFETAACGGSAEENPYKEGTNLHLIWSDGWIDCAWGD